MAGLENLHPVFAQRLGRLAEAVGGLDWTSGYRSSEKQAQLFKCWQERRPGCAPANRPGESNHEAIPKADPRGLAMDIGRRNRDAARSRARDFGIHFPIAHEPWHCQPRECRSAKFTGIPDFADIPNGATSPLNLRGERPMVIVHPEGHVFLLSGGVLTFLSGRAAGEASKQLPTIHVDHAQFEALEQANRRIRGL